MSQIKKIGVVGAGNMGSGIVQKIAQEGIPVVMVDLKDEFVQRGLGTIRRLLQEGVERKIFKPEQVDQILSRITGTTDFKAVADADIVIEAVFEDKQVKTDLFKKLDQICSPQTILATNTSSFYVRDFADKTSRPDRFVGLHYFYHPAKNRLLEVIPHSGTSPETVEKSLLAAKLHGKTSILVKDAPGFAVNRFFVPFLNEAARMLEEGLADIPTIEAAAKQAFKIGMGPFELMNVTGIPIAVHAATTLGNELGPFYAPAPILKAQMEKKANWILEGKVDEAKLSALVDRFQGVCLGVAAALVDEGVASIEDTDRGAKIGLRWILGPFEIMNKIGIGKTYEVVQAIGRTYPDFKMPAILEKQHRLGKPFEFNFVDLEVKNGIAYVTLNRPEAMNALNETVVAQLERRFAEAEADAGVKAIVFQGAGKAFVAGADIRYFVEKIKAGRIPDIVAFTRKGHELLLRIEESRKLTIALLDGLSLGGGSELALACQAIVATPAGSMAFPETGIGILPGARGHAAHGAPCGAGPRQVLRVHGRLHQRCGRPGARHRHEAGRTRGGGCRHPVPGRRGQAGQIPHPRHPRKVQGVRSPVRPGQRRDASFGQDPGRRECRTGRQSRQNPGIQGAPGPADRRRNRRSTGGSADAGGGGDRTGTAEGHFFHGGCARRPVVCRPPAPRIQRSLRRERLCTSS